jgi:hypothetical protein
MGYTWKTKISLPPPSFFHPAYAIIFWPCDFPLSWKNKTGREQEPLAEISALPDKAAELLE